MENVACGSYELYHTNPYTATPVQVIRARRVVCIRKQWWKINGAHVVTKEFKTFVLVVILHANNTNSLFKGAGGILVVTHGNTTLETIDRFFTAAPLIDSAICIDV